MFVPNKVWYEKISLQYNGNFTNSITCKEDYFFKSNFVKDWDNRLKHTLSSSASFMAFKYLSITPSIEIIEFTPQAHAQLVRWIQRRAEAGGKTISPADAEYLMFNCGEYPVLYKSNK